jgi:hypothetical protein
VKEVMSDNSSDIESFDENKLMMEANETRDELLILKLYRCYLVHTALYATKTRKNVTLSHAVGNSGKSAMESKRVHLLKQHRKNLRSKEDWWAEFNGIHPNFRIVEPAKQRNLTENVPENAATTNEQ